MEGPDQTVRERLLPPGSRRHRWARDAYRLATGRPRTFRTPPELVENHRPLDRAAGDQLADALRTHYYTSPVLYDGDVDEYLATPDGRDDFENELLGRTEQFRDSVVPWLHSLRPLSTTRILEVGCGTGASTVGLAEQGADVVGVDLDPGALEAARERMKLYGLEAEFVEANAVDALAQLSQERFDIIIFFAALEHMTTSERLTSLERAWSALEPGDFLVAIDTPNRLWYFDDHTALVPFFRWLDDELALRYSARTPRAMFNTLFRDPTPEAMERFIRWGRSVSFHEFELIMDLRVEELPIVGCLEHFVDPPPKVDLLRPFDTGRRYMALLADIVPDAHPGFLFPSLNLAFRKP